MSRRFLTLWVVAVMAACTACLAHLAMRTETLRLGYDVGEARRELKRLQEQERLLELEEAMLSAPARVTTVGERTLGLETQHERKWISSEGRRRVRVSGQAK